jgi:hypothetical protein
MFSQIFLQGRVGVLSHLFSRKIPPSTFFLISEVVFFTTVQSSDVPCRQVPVNVSENTHYTTVKFLFYECWLRGGGEKGRNVLERGIA